MYCTLEHRDDDYWYCTTCNGNRLNGNYDRQCKGNAPPLTKSDGLTGTHLTNILKWFSLAGKAGCKCKSRAAEMDKNGPDWCEENIDMIVGWMKEGTIKLVRPLTAIGGNAIVNLAIKRAREDMICT